MFVISSIFIKKIKIKKSKFLIFCPRAPLKHCGHSCTHTPSTVKIR